MVRAKKDRDVNYRPIKALPMTGLFPGFAKPLFLPSYVNDGVSNTFYAQRVMEEEIVSFEPVEGSFTDAISLPVIERSVRPGDEPVYVYAFSPTDAAVGFRNEVTSIIEKRFDEIAAKELAACTAAQFARLKSRLPEVNRKAYKFLCKVNTVSARLWRDASVFLRVIKEEFSLLGIPPAAISLNSAVKNKKLQVVLTLELDDLSPAQRSSLERSGRKVLLASGLFGRDDLFTLQVKSADGATYRSSSRLFGTDERDDALHAARRFLEQRVFQPVLATRRASQRSKNLARNAKQWVSRFQKIGDLVRYMDRFKPDGRQPLLPLLEIKQIQFEDVHAEFMRKFARYRTFQTTADDFKEQQRYNAFVLSIYTQTYNNQSGGIRPVGKIGSHKAVVVSVALSGGTYANEWLEPGTRLKCYLQTSRGGSGSKPEEAQAANKSIMKFPKVPVLLFTRQSGERDFLFNGVFRYERVTADEREKKWFELVKVDS